jgi:tetratricopeptide (TPR) repeat protein
MAVRPGWLFLAFLLFAPLPSAPGAESAQARQFWVVGQEAMRRGKTDEAVQYYEQSLAADREQKRTHLSLAASFIQLGDEAGAARQLALYLDAYPEHHVVRLHYADLLLHLGRPAKARVEFERFIADVQDDAALAAKHLVHCHSRLMQIAEAEDDDYAEHLHRGIVLYLLACERAGLPDPDDGELSVESVLCKAAGELTMARLLRRDEARPSWYLYAVWSRLDQRQPALRHLREAESVAPFSFLTPAEQRDLAVACLARDTGTRRR